MKLFSTRHSDRSGTSAVEAAFVLPVFFFLLLAILEFAHAQMVSNVLRSACRAGARVGSAGGVTAADIEARVEQTIAGAIDPGACNILVKDATVFDGEGPYPESASEFSAMPDMDMGEAEPRDLFMVRASVEYNDIALVPMPFMDGVVLDSQAFMRHE